MTVTLKIEKTVYGGDGLGRLGDGRVAFVPGAYAGETVKAEIVEQKKRFVKTRLVGVEEAIPEWKVAHAVLPLEVVPAVAPLAYRNKVVYHTERQHGRWVLGYREEPDHRVVDVTQDPLACPAINAALPSIRSAVFTLLTQGARAVRQSAKASVPDGIRLVGIESARGAVACAKRNAAALGVPANFFCERVGGSLTRIKAGARHTVIVDPPRGGLEPNVAPWLARLPAPRILYVSCDPATLARDLATLARTYDIARVKLFDLFPRTARFETLVVLERKRTSPAG